MNSSLFSVMSIARDGLLANSGGVAVTTQNISGATTPGYVRRTPVLQTRATGGVELAGTSRGFEQFSYGQLLDQESRLSAAQARAGAVSDVEVIATPNTGSLGDAVNSLLAAFTDLSSSPSSTGVRSVVLARAESVAQAFSGAAQGLDQLRTDLYGQATGVVTDVNDRLSKIAVLDQQIAQASSNGDSAADMRDQRDQLVREVASRVGARSVEDAHGSITIFGAGGVLYEGGHAANLSVELDGAGALKVQLQRAGTSTDVTTNIDSGTLGGIREARDFDVAKVQDTIDGYAYDVTNVLNGIHQSGFGLDGTSGRPLFAPLPSPKGAARAMELDPSLVGHPESIAAASSAADLPGGNDVAIALGAAGSKTLSAGDTMVERFATLASNVGALRTATDGDVQVREDAVAAVSSLRESASGVSTDEEMVRLQQFQRGFEASSNVLKTVNDLFDTLLGVVR